MAALLVFGGVAAPSFTLAAPAPSSPGQVVGSAARPFGPFKQVVVIYEENHSFDNLFGGWGLVGGAQVNGRSQAPISKTTQVRQDGSAYGCLLQNDVNLTSPPQDTSCNDAGGPSPIVSAFSNTPFAIDDYIAPADTTCPPPGVFAPHGVVKGAGNPGGCTEDLVHRYYQEQYQINRGKQNRYVTGSDAVGLSMGYYNTQQLPIYQYLNGGGGPNYIVADNFFQAAFGGSFLNHQWFIAANTPTWDHAVNDGGSNDLHSIVDANGMPNNYPLYAATGPVKDGQLTVSCSPSGGGSAPHGVTCGNFAVNTIQPTYQPFSPGTAITRRLPPLTNPTIGDRMSSAGVSWAWYSGGWSNANGDIGAPGWTNGTAHDATCSDPDANPASVFPNCPSKLFQFHHQAFNYYAAYAPGTLARKQHLRDEAEFIQRAQDGRLLQVSFVKPVGAENEHPGYSSETDGSNHLVDLLQAIFDGPQGDSTLVIVTYDEFGGQWDHVPPPGSGPNATGVSDRWGPGTRIPALVISKKFNRSTVDHTSHDTTSILTTIETMFGLQPLGTRDADVASMFDAALSKALAN